MTAPVPICKELPGEDLSVGQTVEELVESLENDRSVDRNSVELVLQARNEKPDGGVVHCAQVQGGTLRDVHVDVIRGSNEAAEGMGQHGPERIDGMQEQ